MSNKKAQTAEQKRLDADLWIIFLVMLAVLAVWMGFQGPIMAAARDAAIPALLRVLMAGAFQYGLAGLGITVVAVLRRESFLSHGLRAKGTVPSVLLCCACFVPHLIFLLATGQLSGYLPFQSVWTTRDLLAAGFPANAAGMLITAVCWGFFEGFNYVVISDKINRRYPGANPWLNWGAISCAVLCLLIHGAIGVTPEGVAEMATIFIIIYGMLLVRERTGNAWGCVAVFVLLWNAF